MNKRYLGIGLILVAFLLAKFLKLNGLSTANIAILMFFGAIAWVGVSMLMSALMPNPSGPDHKMWKMLLNGALGFIALFSIFIVGTLGTHEHVIKELNNYGVVSDAVVVDKDYTTLPAKRGKVNHVYTLTVSFKDQNGSPRQVDSEVGASEYANSNPGRPLKIKYSSRNPDIHKLIFDR